MLDFAHKIISPKTYSCDLCTLTHGNLSEREDWSLFLRETNINIEFYHIDDFEQKYIHKDEYPIIYMRNGDSLKSLFSSKEIATFKDVSDLINKLKELPTT